MRISIVGMQFANSEKFVETIPAGAPLDLRREADNRYDKNAVAVFYGVVKIGYLPKTKNGPVAAHLDARGKAAATLFRSPNSGYPMADVTLEPANVDRATGPAGIIRGESPTQVIQDDPFKPEGEA